ncbi:MAG TPA: RHS repeat-associated core domain-containing protein [Terriglobales bacterium]|nr:RHS repeat-associated core domain-containing protein [Terriglobales bacterium]
MTKFLVFFSLLLTSSVFAQLSNVSASNATPIPGVGHDYIQGLQEIVNPATGSVSLRIDLGAPAGGRSINMPVVLMYDSSGIHQIHQNYQMLVNSWGADRDLGWSFSLPTLSSVSSDQRWIQPTGDGFPLEYGCLSDSSYVFQDVSGTRHLMPISVAYDFSGSGIVACDLLGVPDNHDGGDPFYSAHVEEEVYPGHSPVKIVGIDGTVYHFSSSIPVPTMGAYPDWIEDRNGNRITFSGGYTDTVGRSMPLTYDSTQISVPGFSNPYSIVRGTVNTSYSLGYVWADPIPNAWCSLGGGGGQVSVIYSLTLPNGKQYQFEYDPTYGLLKKITYPTGGYVRYEWGESPLSAATKGVGAYNGTGQTFACTLRHGTPAVMHRYVSFDGITIAQQQDFSYASTQWRQTDPLGALGAWISKQTTVTTRDLIRNQSYDTVYNYVPVTIPDPPGLNGWPIVSQAAVESSTIYKNFDGTTARTVNKGWLDQYRLGCETQTLENGQTSGTWYQYLGYVLVTDKKEYDFASSGISCNQTTAGTSPAAAPMRETVTDYYPLADTAIGGRIVNMVSSVKVYAGSATGIPISQADYVYDGTTIQSVPIPTQHDSSNFGPSNQGPRGNLTSVTAKCFSNCSSDLTTTFTYDQTGQLFSKTDPRGYVTRYHYTDAFASGTGTPPAGVSTNAYLTMLEYPKTASGTVAHEQRFTYGYNDGQLRSSQDQNGQITTYTYADQLLRPTQINLPDGGQTTISYNDNGPYPSITQTKLVTNGSPVVNVITRTTRDGFGHVTKAELLSDPDCQPSGTATQTTYDGLGLMKSQSNPYCGSPNAWTYTDYDALGRVTLVTKQDGGTVQSNYGTSTAGVTTTVTDEAGNQRRSYTDGLGRLIQVDEPGSQATTVPPAAGTASVTINGSLQSGQTQTQPAAPGSGSTGISGSNSSTWGCLPEGGCMYFDDYGYITLRVNGYAVTANYNQSSTPQSLAGALAQAMNASGPAYATANGVSITLTAKTAGAATNYSYSVSCTSTFPSYQYPYYDVGLYCGFGGGSGNLSGGHDAVYSTTYDSGTTNITINGQQVSYAWSGSGTTPASVASGLSSAVNTTSTYATATVNGGTVYLTARTTGAATNYSLSSSISQQYGSFSSSPSGSAFIGGTDGSVPVYSLSTPWVTNYQYDVLGNLLRVDQKGTAPSDSNQWRTRWFTYDSLSRLIVASNPESGNIGYAYDANGNVATKSDARGIVTTYTYDELNRLKSKTYSDSTPAARFGYDGIAISGCTTSPPPVADTYPKPYRTAMCDGSGATSWSHDKMGRELSEKRTIGTVTAAISNVYNKDGSLFSVTYPSNRTVTYAPGGAGRSLDARDLTNGINYATAAHYTPSGALASLTNGASLKSTFLFNSRLQPCWIYATTGTPLNWQATPCTATATVGNLLDLKYNFSLGNGNNGNVRQITNNRDGNRTQNFAYDPLNRIVSAYTTSSLWGETFDIDAWGNLKNRTVYPGKPNPEPWTFGTATAQNRLSTLTYDAAGNTTNDTVRSYGYDAENRIVSVGGSPAYVYDGDGNRVKKNAGVLYWGAAPLAESDLAGTITSEYIFFDGKRIARVDPSCCGGQPAYRYYFSDQLGSASVITNETGVIQDESEYYPYGGEKVIVNNDPNHFKFTGKEHDTETGLDYFGARYYGNNMGRFLSVDPDNAGAELQDPQSWNAYSYVGNNPLTFTDPDGLAKSVCRTDSNGNDACYWEGEYNGEYDKNQKLYWNAGTGEWQKDNPVPINENFLASGATNPGFLGPADVFFVRVPNLGIMSRLGKMLGLGEKAAAGATQGAAAGGRGLLTATEGVIVSNGTKQAAKQAIEQMAAGAQKASLKRAIDAAGSQAKITVQQLSDGSVRVMVNRAGVNGGQTMIKTVATDGTSKTVQVAVDGAGNLVHYHPKN